MTRNVFSVVKGTPARSAIDHPTKIMIAPSMRRDVSCLFRNRIMLVPHDDLLDQFSHSRGTSGKDAGHPSGDVSDDAVA